MVAPELLPRAKESIRRKIIDKRKTIGDIEIEQKSLAIGQRLLEFDALKKSNVILCFLSLPYEVQTDLIIRKIINLGKKVLVPLGGSNSKDLQLARIPTFDMDFVVGQHGIREPSPKSREIVSCALVDFVMVPGLAFDCYGNRVGYGSGYYDRLLNVLSRDAVTTGVGYDFQVLSLVPHSNMDRSVQFVMTETKTFKCSSYGSI